MVTLLLERMHRHRKWRINPREWFDSLSSSVVIIVQSLHRVYSTILWTAAHQASLSFTISWSLLKLMSIESVMPFNNLILCQPLPLWPSVFPSTRVFSMSQLFTSGEQSTGTSASGSSFQLMFRTDFL